MGFSGTNKPGGAASDTVTVHDTGLVLVALSTLFYFANVRMFLSWQRKCENTKI